MQDSPLDRPAPGLNPSAGTKTLPHLDPLASILDDIDVMRLYATQSGKPFDEDLAGRLSRLIAIQPDDPRPELSIKADAMPEYAAPEAEPPSDHDAEIERAAHYELALRVHAGLTDLISPANPRSLRATDYGHSFWPFRATPVYRLLFFVGWISFTALILFAWSTYKVENKEHVQYWGAVQYLAAAFLGSGFATFIRATPFIVRRTFDNQYIPVYLMRYALGLMAGVILANLGDVMLNAAGAGGAEDKVEKFSQSLLAIVGGFSAMAVAEILNRISDTLVALVKGPQGDQVGQYERLSNEKIKAIKDQQRARQKEDAVGVLAELEVDGAKSTEKARQMLREIISDAPVQTAAAGAAHASRPGDVK